MSGDWGWGDKPRGELVPHTLPWGSGCPGAVCPLHLPAAPGLGEVLAGPFQNRVGKAGWEGGWQRAALPSPPAGMPTPHLVRGQR